jgi:hypothetical protein
MQAPYGSTSGYVALIFLDDNRKEISRVKVSFQPTPVLIWAGATNSKGQFKMSMPAAYKGSTALEFDFPGNSTFRVSSTKP